MTRRRKQIYYKVYTGEQTSRISVGEKARERERKKERRKERKKERKGRSRIGWTYRIGGRNKET